MNYSKKKMNLIISIIGLILLKSIQIESALTLELRQNTTAAPLTKDASYYYLDTYINTCLGRIDSCSNGFTVVFNLSLAFNQAAKASLNSFDTSYTNGRIVLASSGGDSPFSNGGFYLHQINVRNDKYLEVGVSNRNDLYSTRVYLDTVSNAKLGLTWNQKGMNVYVDGILYKTVSIPINRSYHNLNFNAFKSVKTIIPKTSMTSIVGAFFNDSILDTTDLVVKGNKTEYYLGCFNPSNPSSVVDISLISATQANIDDQCKLACVNSNNQVYLVQGLKCACFANLADLGSQVTKEAKCALPSWSAYVATHLSFSPKTSSFKLTPFRPLSQPIEIDDTLGFSVEFSNSNNYKTSFEFSNGNSLSLIGSGNVFTEYSKPGPGSVNIVSTDLKDNSVLNSQKLEFTIIEKVDRLPMSYVRLRLDQLSEKNVDITATAYGGHPFVCTLDVGDGSPLSNFDSYGRNSTFNKAYAYANTGIYNVSITCKNSQSVGIVSRSKIVFLPNKHAYIVNSNIYELSNLKQVIVQKNADSSTFDLELPFVSASSNLKFIIVDISNEEANEITSWTSGPASSVPSDTNLVIKLKSNNLVDGDNYFGIKCHNVSLASYLITVEDTISVKPTLKVQSDAAIHRLKEELTFDVSVQMIPNALIKLEFGDGNVKYFQTSKLNTTDSVAQIYSFTVTHTYRKGTELTAKLTMANHVSRVETSLSLVFEADLPDLQLLAPTEVHDITDTIVLKLVGPFTAATVVPSVKFSLDAINDPTNERTFTSYSFDPTNDYSLSLSFQYAKFGIYQITVLISNAHNSQEIKAQIKVGSNIQSATGQIVSGHYAAINEPVTFSVKIQGGNGYQIQLNSEDGQITTVPWSFIKTKVSTAEVKFQNNGIQLTYKYQQAGEYTPSILVSNVFSNLTINFCSKVIIAAKSAETSSVCNITNNIVANINDDELSTTLPLNFGKAVANTFSVSYTDCSQHSNTTEISTFNADLQTYWILNRLVYKDSRLQEEQISNYCFVKGNGNQFLIEKNELLYGDYSLKVHAFNVNTPDQYVLLGNYVIKVGAAPLVNGFQGPYNVELNWNEILDLNFYKKSVDPDSLAENQLDMNFDFICVNDPVINSQLIATTQQKVKENDFNPISLGYNLAFDSPEYHVRFFDRNCILQEKVNGTEVNPISLNVDTMLLSIDALGMNLNFTTNKRPLVIQMVLSKLNRLSISKQAKVFLNISSMPIIMPSLNLDEMENQLAQLDNLVDKDPKKALSMLGNFADAINSRSNENDNTTITNTTTAAQVSAVSDKLTGLRGKMLGTVDKIVNAVDDPDSFLSAADMTASVTSNGAQMPAGNQESGSNVMASMGAKLLQVGPEGAAMIGNVAESMLGTVGNVFGAACDGTPTVELDLSNINLLESENETIPEPEPLPAKIAAPLEFYEVDTEDFPEDKYETVLDEEFEQEEKNIAVREKTSEIAKKSFDGISNAGGAMANNSDPNGNGTSKVEKKGMAIVASKKPFNASSEEDSSFGTDAGPSIKMPSLGKVIKDGSAPASVSSKMLVSGSNPFQSSSPDKQAKGTIVSMELTDENGVPLVINGTDEPFVIQVPNQIPAKSYRSSVDLFKPAVFKLYLPTDSSSLHFVLKPDTPGDYFHVYVSKYTLDTPSDQKYPNEVYHHYKFTLPNNRKVDDPASELPFTAFIGNNETQGNGTYYISVKLIALSEATKLYKQKMMNNSHDIQVNYTVRVFTTACKYWHAATSEWLTDGCFVADTTDYMTTVCKCFHLTTFGGDMVVPPNTIDFGSVFSKFNLNDNAGVFSTVITILGLYVFVALYARYMDKKDILKWGATPLCDNLPTDSYFYLISVQTGFGRDCGTRSKINFVLSGEDSDSGVRKLTDDKRKAFKAGSICNFLMGVEEPLGPLTHLRIWHDNSGKGSSKSWYLNVVGVHDLQSNEKSNFVCNKWFAVEKEDGQIDRVLPVACRNDLTTFKHLFTQSVKKKFTDNHLWFSVFSRPTKSNFTRLQRISTCMSLLFCTMIANAMFYKADSPNSGKQAIQVGPIKFTLSQLFTSIVSTMIVVPVNVIIVTLFRKAKVVHHGILPVSSKRANHVAKQRHWRQNIQSIEFESSTTNFDSASGEFETTDREAYSSRKRSNFLNIFSKNKTVEYKRESKQDEMNKKRGRTLPHWVIYISWTLCAVSTLVPAFFVILYSMQWGKERSNGWLTSIGLSFFQSLLVVDPLKVFIVTALITLIMRKPEEEGEDSPVDCGDPYVNAIVNKDEEYLHKNSAGLSQVDIREILHSRRAPLTKLEPIDPEELERQRIARLQSIRLKAFLKEASIYLGFLLVVLFLAHQGRTKNSNNVHHDLQKTFLINENQIFAEVQSRDDFWNYMDTTFLPGLYAPVWYNNKSLVWREKLTSLNRQAIRVGAARLRQLRVKDNTCRIHPRVREIIPKERCRASYNWVDDDTKDYDPAWAPKKNVTVKPKGRKKNKNDYCTTPWCYQNTLLTKSVPIKGTYTTYKGGGYVLVLGRSLDKSLVMVDELKNNNWIDGLTRAVFFEFTVYNPNVNLFASCTFIVEFLSTGAATTYASISVFSLYNYLGSMGVVVLVFQIAYVAFFSLFFDSRYFAH